MTPSKVGVSDAKKGFGGQKECQGTQKKLPVAQPLFFQQQNKSVIGEPHRDLLHWNLSWAFTFKISVYKEKSECMYVYLGRCLSKMFLKHKNL